MTERDDNLAFFSQGVEDCMDALYGAAIRLTRHSADAEDLVAEAVARAWSAIGTLTDRSRFRAWLFRVLHNCFVSDYRKKAVRPAESSLDAVFVDEGDGDLASLLNEQSDEFLNWWACPERSLFNKLLGERITAAIDELPEAFRMAILLVNVDGLTYDEAAEVLGVPPGTVRSRMKRGRTLLQKALWEHATEAGLTLADTMNGSTP